ncbi:MAG: outer membrane protein assembly factor [Variovorax sp.]|nr:outer membrane protein assembly factor [Variovorax sp.]
MFRVASLLAPAWKPALFFVLVLFLQGCSLLRKNETPGAPGAPVQGAGGETGTRETFGLQVQAPEVVRDYLLRHLEIQRYRRLGDLQAAELSRLMVAAEANARELLGTLGYFTPTLTLELKTPSGAAQGEREIAITVEPGPLSHIDAVAIDFSGPIAADPASKVQRERIANSWPLRAGQPFSQSAWEAAKTQGLRALTARRYPTGRIATSRAEIDADRQVAKLGVTYESGPPYRFGTLQVRGSQRYDPDGARRLARLPSGEEYDQDKLLAAQQRLASSGYFDSVFLTLDTGAGDPQAAPVIAQVREAPLQKVVLGVGLSTDSGARVSIDHIHNRLPVIGWRAVSRLSIDRKNQSLGSEWTALPDDDNGRWFGSGLLQREESGSYHVDSGRLRAGRNKGSDHIDRSYFLQYDYAVNQGTGAPPSASTVSLNWGWTGRYFDNAGQPRRGQGLALEVAAGYTLLGERVPYLRSYARWLGLLPLGTVRADDGSEARDSRLQLRAEAGAVVAKDTARIPATQLFLTGGDTTVRGYGYRDIGSVNALGATVAGRYLAVGSLEWQRPVVYNGRLTPFESVAFVDAGAVADRASQLKTKVGVGAGVRWNSPLGVVQGDLAYGVSVRRLRLHVRLGFTF